MFNIHGKTPGAVYNAEVSRNDDILFVRVTARFASAVVPDPFTLTWDEPCIDAYSTLSPSIRSDRGLHPSWRPQKTETRINQFMPVHQIVSLQGRNRVCVAVSDVQNPLTIKSGVRESDACFEFNVEFFSMPTAEITEYAATVRVDRRDIPYEESLADAANWWRETIGFKPACAPEAASDAVYSSWYSFHHTVNREGLLRECRLARELGMKTLIIDDGWQTDLSYGDPSYIGDWIPSSGKMGDMKELVAEVHKLGMRVLLWFAAPFMGKNTAHWNEFQGMLISGNERAGVFNLDPRYEAVRKYVTQRLQNAVSEWDLDGLKIDFVNNFVPKPETYELKPEMDCRSFPDAVDRLMKDIHQAVTAIRPDALIEFRQSYIGPAICRYGNILRVADSPNDAIRNRADVMNIRLFNDPCTVHSDMLMWNMSDSVQSAAIQLADCLYSVPQISVLIEKLPNEHYRMLKYYLEFWTQYRNVLLRGRLTAAGPESRFTQVCSTLNDTSVITCYADGFVELKTPKAVIVNASMKTKLAVINCAGRKYQIKDCMGNTLMSGAADWNLAAFDVPMGGMLFLD